MTTLPDEIWTEILDYLDPPDIVSSQATCRRLLKLARSNHLWRFKCFEKAPSAAGINADRLDALAGALGSLSLSGSPPPVIPETAGYPRPSKRSKKVAEWDHAAPSERIDWYSEYIARHAPLSTVWHDDQEVKLSEVRGVALHDRSEKALTCHEDGTLAIWDIRERAVGRRKFQRLAQSHPGVLFESRSNPGGPSKTRANTGFTGVADSITVDSKRQNAYVAVDRTLNEVDLETLQVVSQTQYAWPITALSQQGDLDLAISVGTSWSLHLYDPRVPWRDRSRSPEDLMHSVPGEPEDSIAFLPNYAKGRNLPTAPPANMQQMMGHPVIHSRSRRGRAELSDYAQIEPGPLSILHYGADEILIAGRFPSILSYDRRYFPRLQYVMHSGARLSSLTTIPHPPNAATSSPAPEATLVACGEYGGRGSLELYQLPHGRGQRTSSSTDFGMGRTSPELGAADREHAIFNAEGNEEHPYSYKNRSSASSAKLLSVATQGTRIVFSDAEGGIKWVERDGSGLARRWNINSFDINERGGSASGDLVARRILPMQSRSTGDSTKSDNDLLIWTGEKAGIISTTPQMEAHDELVAAFEEKMDLGEKEERERAEEYSNMMRQALERQADERRWMSQFRLKRGLF